MKHISDIPKQGDCLIIANGRSSEKIKWERLRKDLTIIGINRNSYEIKVDYIIYFDSKIYGHDPKEYYKYIHKDIKLIGSKENVTERCNYYYTFNDIVFSDSGSHAIQIMKGFDNIYLLGYDYDRDKKKHYYDDINLTDNECYYCDMWLNRSIHKYYKPYCKCTNEVLFNMSRDKRGVYNCKCKEKNIFGRNIFNLNSESKLKIFPYKKTGVIYE